PERLFDGDQITMPYGLLSLAAQAKRAGHDVIPLNLFTFAWGDVIGIIRGLPADLYGLSCFTGNRRGTLSVSRLIRDIHPKAFIVVGGPHATALPGEMLEHCEAIDGVVIGEGEETFNELVERIDRGDPVRGLAGMALRTDHGVEIGPSRKRIDDLDSLASPYDYYEGNMVITSRGCPGNCTFCGSPAMWGKEVRFHSAGYIVDMLERMVNTQEQKVIFIKDDTFTASRKRVIEICEGIVKRRLNFLWSCDTRVDMLDEEVLFAMRGAGCQRISMGVESASPEILKTINKRITPEKIAAATRMAKKFGFQIRYYMMAGNRGESAETLQASVDFILAAKPNQFLFSFLSLYPGTAEFYIAEGAGLASREMFFSKDLLSFTHFQTKDWSPPLRELVEWLNTHPGVRDFWDHSIEERERILELFPDLPAAHMDLGGAHYQAGNLDEAEGHVHRSIDMGYPLPGTGFNYLACIAARRGNLRKAVGYLGQAMESGIHEVVERNLQLLREYLVSGGMQKGECPGLVANHNFERYRSGTQPSMPANICFRNSEALPGSPVVFVPQQ
ncbi:MAG: radical SAM protein, partial [Pseudomonadota bacterium]